MCRFQEECAHASTAKFKDTESISPVGTWKLKTAYVWDAVLPTKAAHHMLDDISKRIQNWNRVSCHKDINGLLELLATDFSSFTSGDQDWFLCVVFLCQAVFGVVFPSKGLKGALCKSLD